MLRKSFVVAAAMCCGLACGTANAATIYTESFGPQDVFDAPDGWVNGGGSFYDSNYAAAAHLYPVSANPGAGPAYAFFGNNSLNSVATTSATTVGTFTDDTLYSLSLYLGGQLSADGTYTVELLADGASVASTSVLQSAIGGAVMGLTTLNFDHVGSTYTGKDIGIRVSLPTVGTNTYAGFDEVTLTATPYAPEPSTLVLAVLSLVGLAVRRSRRQRS